MSSYAAQSRIAPGRRPGDWTLLILRHSANAKFATVIEPGVNQYGLAADLAVLHIFLVRYRWVDADFQCLPTVGALNAGRLKG